MSEVLAITKRRTNAELIADAAQLGYIPADGLILDPTYGLGGFWRTYRPARLVTNDLDPARASPADFTALPYRDNVFDAVVFDPPYKLNGTGGGGPGDQRYGVAGPYRPVASITELIHTGITETARVTKPGGYLLVKLQDQVVSGRVTWQTIDATNHAASIGLRLADSLLFTGGRKQPAGRRQIHARRNYSTLLIFQKHVKEPTNG